ncbi:hypothetical protein LAT59_04000 [Candidatus Gracilibacteria bacterium]|nr:hypothetical protein [Candidatus Gracilibacteria bacterium]
MGIETGVCEIPIESIDNPTQEQLNDLLNQEGITLTITDEGEYTRIGFRNTCGKVSDGKVDFNNIDIHIKSEDIEQFSQSLITLLIEVQYHYNQGYGRIQSYDNAMLIHGESFIKFFDGNEEFDLSAFWQQ